MEEEGRFQIDSVNNIYCEVAPFYNKVYVHLRKYDQNGERLKNIDSGLHFLASEWPELIMNFGMGIEGDFDFANHTVETTENRTIISRRYGDPSDPKKKYIVLTTEALQNLVGR